MNYPKSKMQWVIVDDSEVGNHVAPLLPPKDKHEKCGLKYIRLTEKKTIGEKRNIGIENAKHDIIICMDDDDYYYPDAFRKLVSGLLNNETKQCVCCSTIGSFDINRYISMINIAPHELPFQNRVSEATLCFYKDFWVDGKFSDSNTVEAEGLLNGRVDKVAELCWENIIVSLLHKDNTSDRRAPRDQESNGCHFGFSEDLFKFIVSLGEEPKKEDKPMPMIKQKKETLDNDASDNTQQDTTVSNEESETSTKLDEQVEEQVEAQEEQVEEQ